MLKIGGVLFNDKTEADFWEIAGDNKYTIADAILKYEKETNDVMYAYVSKDKNDSRCQQQEYSYPKYSLKNK